MAEIDVSELTLDPYLMGEHFVVLRRQDIVNQYGESVTTDISLPGIGAVYPAGENSLLREEAFQTQSRAITIVTKFGLRGPSKDQGQTNAQLFQPDVVLWLGNHYQVRTIESFAQFGAGFVQADCIAIDYALLEETPQ